MLETVDAYLRDPVARAIGYGTAGILVLGLAALVFALAIYARRRNWKTAPGRVVSAQPGFEIRQRFASDPPRNERIAMIVYRFSVGSLSFESDRIRDSGEPPEEDIDRLLATYQAGATVVVNYDPADPAQCALEISPPPKGLALGCLTAIAMLVATAITAVWLINNGAAGILRVFPHAIVPALIASSAVALMFFLGFLFTARQALEASKWSRTPGRIVQSGVHRFQMENVRRQSRSAGGITTAYMPVVEYAYRVNGVDHASRSIWADTEVSGSEAYARSIAERYPVGRDVTVRFDPNKPTRTAIEPPGRLHWLFLVGAVVASVAAVFAAGLFA